MGTGPFRIRSLLIYLKQVSIHSIKLFSQDVFIQKLRFQSTFLRHELSSARGFSFPLRGNPRLGHPQGKDDQMFSSVVPFPSFTSSDQQETPQEDLLKIKSEWISAHQCFPEQQN